MYQSINWSAVLRKEIDPPFKPYISDELDVGNFSDEFTTLAPIDSPAQLPTKHSDIFRVRERERERALSKLSVICHPLHPQGYSFIAAPVLFTDNLFTALASNGTAQYSTLKVSPNTAYSVSDH